MIITLLCEPRSGSTNLTNWFYHNKHFTTLFIPSDPQSKWYKSIPPSEYLYSTKHLFIKEDYYPHKNYSEFVNISDKLICLYRENSTEQIESWINANTTNNWHMSYVYKKKENTFTKEKTEFFKKLKISFKEKYLDKEFFKISYEELYYDNGFQKIVDYINLDCVKNEKFPIGQKYRINSVINKLI